MEDLFDKKIPQVLNLEEYQIGYKMKEKKLSILTIDFSCSNIEENEMNEKGFSFIFALQARQETQTERKHFFHR